jgi:serine/threonine-protein kinase
VPEREIAPALDVQKLEPGTVLGRRFRVIERIGGGGFGTVYRVEDVVVHEELVLKVLSPHLSLDESMIRRFVQELRLSRRITHRNVIRIHDLIDLNGAHAISMEYFTGRDLGSLMRRDGPFPMPRLLGIARQILDGLAAAHELGIIHRDIKPANVLLGDGDLVKIVDFGLASVGQSSRSRLTQSGILVGTPEYISPEQITGQDVDGRTDLYSVGVVLWELATGRQAFQGENAVNVLFQHLEPKVPRLKTVLPEVSDAVDELVMSCMARHPVDRPGSVAAALAMLDRAA